MRGRRDSCVSVFWCVTAPSVAHMSVHTHRCASVVDWAEPQASAPEMRTVRRMQRPPWVDLPTLFRLQLSFCQASPIFPLGSSRRKPGVWQAVRMELISPSPMRAGTVEI